MRPSLAGRRVEQNDVIMRNRFLSGIGLQRQGKYGLCTGDVVANQTCDGIGRIDATLGRRTAEGKRTETNDDQQSGNKPKTGFHGGLHYEVYTVTRRLNARRS